MANNPFKHHRFPPQVILLAVRWYSRYPLSYRDVRDLLCERGIHVDPATINRWVIKFGPLIAKRARPLRYPRTMLWHVDETYIRVAGKWRYLWRIVDQRGQFVDSRLTSKRDSKVAKAFLKQGCRDSGLYPPMTIITVKAPTYPAIIRRMHNHAYTDKPIGHINQKWCNNRIESDHAALKRIANPGKGFQSLRCAKVTQHGIEALRTIKRGHLFDKPSNCAAELRLLWQEYFHRLPAWF